VVNDAFISRALRNRFGMKYQRVKLVAFRGNSD